MRNVFDKIWDKLQFERPTSPEELERMTQEGLAQHEKTVKMIGLAARLKYSAC